MWKARENFADDLVHNILRFLMVAQTFLSPQVKRNVIISDKLVYTSCVTRCRTS